MRPFAPKLETMDLSSLLDEVGLANEHAMLAPFAEFEIALVPNQGHEPTLGETRIGGGADAPEGFEWPCQRWPLTVVARWPEYSVRMVNDARAKGQARDEDGHLVMPLSFLMQVDLATVRAHDAERRLPERGLLLFFASSGTDIEDSLFGKRVASAVRFVDAPREALRNHAQPPTPDPFPTSAIALRPERRLSLSLSYEDLQEIHGRVTTPAQKKFLMDATTEGLDALLATATEEINGLMPPAGEVALARIVDHADVELFIGDASWLTFSMPIDDLAALRFESARASVYIG